MKKQINKKILILFFVIAALMQFGSTKPMMSKISKLFTCLFSSCCFCQPSTETSITVLPYDCWIEIFRFCPHSVDLACTLRLVCKGLLQVVQGGRMPLSLMIDCENKNKINFSKFNQLGYIAELATKELDYGLLAKTKLKNLLLNLHSLKVEWCDTFAWAELKNLKNLRSLTVIRCSKFDKTGLENLKNLRSLTVQECGRFDGAELKNLKNLHSLTVVWCSEFDGVRLKNLKNLYSLTVRWCSRFTGKGLKDLKNLHRLRVEECDEFDKTVLKNMKNLYALH